MSSSDELCEEQSSDLLCMIQVQLGQRRCLSVPEVSVLGRERATRDALDSHDASVYHFESNPPFYSTQPGQRPSAINRNAQLLLTCALAGSNALQVN